MSAAATRENIDHQNDGTNVLLNLKFFCFCFLILYKSYCMQVFCVDI